VKGAHPEANADGDPRHRLNHGCLHRWCASCGAKLPEPEDRNTPRADTASTASLRVATRSAEARPKRDYITTRPSPVQPHRSGTYVLVALDAQIAGYVLSLPVEAAVVMCGLGVTGPSESTLR
jgi:hypothetical protein